jgi:hypothetical protein
LLGRRRFPPPWTVEELDACFVVTDSARQKLAYLYFEDQPGRRLPGILHVNLSTGKSNSDGNNNDDEGHKRQISRSNLFFALRASPRLQV